MGLLREGDRPAVSAAAIEGYVPFTGRAAASYATRHSLFHDVGLEFGKATPDPGRFNVTKEPRDTGAFKTPTLRSVAVSRP